MGKFIQSLAPWLAAVCVWLVISSTLSAGPLETSGQYRWIVFASRQDVDEAIGLARRFGTQFGQPTVLSTMNGWYAVAAGPTAVSDVTAFKKKLSDAWWPPKDTFLAKGQSFIQKEWERPLSPILAAASTGENQPRFASAKGLEIMIELANGRHLVRVRSGGREVASVVFNDDGPYFVTAALIAQLDASSPFPQVIATHFTGGAHCCTIMKALTFVHGRWEAVKVGEFDSEGPSIEDLNGDGSVELVGKDDSFDYAFASYAELYAPPKVYRLFGDSIADVSLAPEFRRPILQMLLANQGLATQEEWRDNGFLGGWVAHNFLIGNGAEAWQKMLSLYSRSSDWDLSVCTILTKGYDPCPEYAKRRRDFPTALREHLANNGYLVAGRAPEPAPSSSVSPSNPSNAPSGEPSPRAPSTAEPSLTPKPEKAVSSGTGFFVTRQGSVVTNAHVVEDCSIIHVTSAQGEMAVAKVVARDVRNDLALLGGGPAAKEVAAFRTSIRLGEAVEAFGYPLVEVLSKSGNFTLGNVSALVGLGEDSRYLQISTPVQPGNSGGPLLDQNGNVVGVVSAKLNALKVMVATNGDIAQNVNFAIKSSVAVSFLDANGVELHDREREPADPAGRPS